jgi:hypothetical protein
MVEGRWRRPGPPVINHQPLPISSPLPLLMFRVFLADDPNDAFAFNDLTLLTHFFDRRSNFHNIPRGSICPEF